MRSYMWRNQNLTRVNMKSFALCIAIRQAAPLTSADMFSGIALAG